MTCRSIQRFCGAHHTPGLGALVANLVLVQSDARDGRVYLQCLGQGLEAATDPGWRLVWGPFGHNLISEMLKRKDIQLRHCRISLIQNLEKQSPFSIYIVADNSTRSRWTMKLQHLQHGQTSHCQRISKTWHHDMPQHSAIPRSPPHTRPWRPRHQSGSLTNLWQINVRDGRVCLQRLGQGLEAATDQGWRLVRGPFGQNLISEMLKKDIQLRHVESLRFKTWKKQSRNPRFHSASTYSMTM